MGLRSGLWLGLLAQPLAGHSGGTALCDWLVLSDAAHQGPAVLFFFKGALVSLLSSRELNPSDFIRTLFAFPSFLFNVSGS